MNHGECPGSAATGPGHQVARATALSPVVHRLDVVAARIAEVRQAGQFVIVHQGPGAERIPLTIAEADADAGTIGLVIQAVGRSTRDLVTLRVGDVIADIAGPVGQPTELVDGQHAVCVGGGVGTAVVLPIARALYERGNRVTSVIGGRAADSVLFGAELGAVGDVIVCTDDGSAGRPGLVTDALATLIERGGVDVVHAAGPVPMMRGTDTATSPSTTTA